MAISRIPRIFRDTRKFWFVEGVIAANYTGCYLKLMPEMDLDTLRRIGRLPELTDTQKLRMRINSVGVLPQGNSFVGTAGVRFTERNLEQVLTGRSESVNFVGRLGIIHWGFDSGRSWIGVWTRNQELNYVSEKKGDLYGQIRIARKVVDKWVASPLEVEGILDYRDRLLGLTGRTGSS